MTDTLTRPTEHDGDSASAGIRVSASSWHASLAGAVDVVRTGAELPWQVVRLLDTPSTIRQPPLLDDIICIHGGGAKEVRRTRGLRRTSHKVELGAVTVMPRGCPAHWETSGPIAYTHVVLAPKALNSLLVSELDCDRDRATLSDDVGVRDPLLESLLLEMSSASVLLTDTLRLYKEALFTAMVLRLFLRSGAGAATGRGEGERPYASGGLAGFKLRRVTEFIQEHRGQDIGYDDLIALTGLSRAQFFRAFKQSLGVSPGRYLEQVRLDHAKRLLDTGAALKSVAAASGFPTVAAMSRAFRHRLGVSPTSYRGWYR